MTELEALISLNLVLDIGALRLRKLLDFFDKPQNILKASAEKLCAVSGIGAKLAAKISSFKKEDLVEELRLAKKHNLKIISFLDEDYPDNLKQTTGYPVILYVKGRFEKTDKFSIAIVGSRRASFYGLTNAGKFARDLSGKNFTIVSGMARGVDTYAHKGVLEARGRTIAVMGSGFNHIYPPENAALAEEICQNGAVISEFPIDTKPLRQNFPRRNRVISGLCRGVLVVEAARNSGALITADFALEQNREVFALPGQIDSNTSFGTNSLIKQGAKLVSSVDEILEEFNLAGTQAPVLASNASQNRQQNQPDLPSLELKGAFLAQTVLEGQEEILYNLLSNEPVAFDEILEKTNLAVPELSKIIFNLEMKKLIKQLPGKQYIRN